MKYVWTSHVVKNLNARGSKKFSVAWGFPRWKVFFVKLYYLMQRDQCFYLTKFTNVCHIRFINLNVLAYSAVKVLGECHSFGPYGPETLGLYFVFGLYILPACTVQNYCPRFWGCTSVLSHLIEVCLGLSWA